MCNCNDAQGGLGGGGGTPLPQSQVEYLLEDLGAIQAQVDENTESLTEHWEPVSDGDPDDPSILFDDEGDVVMAIVPNAP